MALPRYSLAALQTINNVSVYHQSPKKSNFSGRICEIPTKAQDIAHGVLFFPSKSMFVNNFVIQYLDYEDIKRTAI